MNRRLLWSLLLGLGLGGTMRAQDDRKTLVVSPLPTFAELTKTGIRFRLPSQLFSNFRTVQNTPPDITLEGEKAAIALKSESSSSPVITWDQIHCRFAGDELAAPGEYYPPKLPIADQSKTASLYLGTGDEVAAIFKNVVATLQALGIQDAKLTTWIESEIWKNSPNFNGNYTQTNGVEISLYVVIGADGKAGRFGINFSRPRPTEVLEKQSPGTRTRAIVPGRPGS